ncbi:hypothetical protein WOLCODRAFT_17452 [Wolfiporia cocos MD-104 SS10]|uniref:Uncharacterized protein n=1 Tax=Wolfiporia cocos (strain MD-104) TaxID=742152 RepID=A0A2H3JIM2_WOLCO|nr:hypothetical protein WOLCODRAFT_17452 [Wolfiporia cocos MD-104 SS10]
MDIAECSREREERQAPAGDGVRPSQAATPTVPTIVMHPSEAPEARGRPISRFGRVFSRRSHSNGDSDTMLNTASISSSLAVDNASSSWRSSSALTSRFHRDKGSKSPTPSDVSSAFSAKAKTKVFSDQNLDVALTIARDVAKGLGACASLIPSAPGLDIVMKGLERVLDGVVEARGNTKEVKEVAESIKQLVDAVKSAYELVSGRKLHVESVPASENMSTEGLSTGPAETLTTVEATRTSEASYDTNALQQAISQLVV